MNQLNRIDARAPVKPDPIKLCEMLREARKLKLLRHQHEVNEYFVIYAREFKVTGKFSSGGEPTCMSAAVFREKIVVSCDEWPLVDTNALKQFVNYRL